MNNFNTLINNYVLMTAIIGWASAQIIKTIIDCFINKKISFERLVGSGGMPSCHSATVCALSTASALEYGLGSFEFAITAMFAIIVMYDARGVRRETGNQAEVLNQMIDFFKSERPEQIIFSQDKLKELIGHTPLQVFIGAMFGIGVAFITFALMH